MPETPDGGIAAYVLGLLRSPLADAYELVTLDVRVPRFFRRWQALRPLLTLHFLAGLVGRLGRRRPRLAHVHTSDYNGFWEKALLCRVVRASGTPYLIHLHGGSFDRFLSGLEGRAAGHARRVLEGAARVVVLSKAWCPIVSQAAPAARLVVLPNAIDCAEFESATHHAPNPVPRLLCLGMLSARKGLDDLLQALLELRRQSVGFEMDIVGDEEFPGELARYRGLYAAAGLAPDVRFPGAAYGTTKLDYLRRADLFVLPSRSESFGIANLEAMASGLAVVSTRTGAIPEYIEDGVHGLLVAPADPRGLSAALQALIADPDRRRQMGEAARRRARDYDWSVVAGDLARLYADLLAPDK